MTVRLVGTVSACPNVPKLSDAPRLVVFADGAAVRPVAGQAVSARSGRMTGVEPVEIRVDGLLLRPWRPDDAAAVHRACQDPILQHWSSGLPAPFPLAEAVRFVGEAAPAALADGTALFLAIVDEGSGEVLGNTDLRGIDLRARTAELAYWSAPWARGRRLTERASRALLRWGFEELGLARVDWRATVGNHASRLTGLRLGFTMMGVLPNSARLRDGSLTDQWVGTLLPADLTAAPPGWRHSLMDSSPACPGGC